MTKKWEISRSLKMETDGQGRWDIAYQLLWKWTQELEKQVEKKSIVKQEMSDEDSIVCTSIDESSSPSPDNRATNGQTDENSRKST